MVISDPTISIVNLRCMLKILVRRVCLEEDIFNSFNSSCSSFDFVDLKTYLQNIIV